MRIDTSSYYPEVDGPEKREDDFSLNSRSRGLFGDSEEENQETDLEKEEDQYDADMRNNLEEINQEREESRNNEEPENGISRGITIFSNILSWILVPLLMPVYGIMLAFGLSVLELVPFDMRVSFTLIVAGINFLIPVLLVLLLKFLGIVDDVGLNGQRERLIPYMITILCMGATAWFVGIKGAPIWLSMFFAGGAAAGLVNLIINLKWKISAHAAAIAGVVAMLIRLGKVSLVEPELFTWILITIGAAGLLGSARIWLGRHTVWQVLAGYAVGFCCVFFLMYIH